MQDPPTEVRCISVRPYTSQERDHEIRMVYRFPKRRNTLVIYPAAVGNTDALISFLWRWQSEPFLLSVVYLAIGAAVLCISFLFLRFGTKSNFQILFWSGCFLSVIGLWIFGESNFTGLLLKQPMMLYFVAFMAFQTCAIPFLKVCRLTILFHKSKWLDILDKAAVVYPCGRLIFQITGICPFYQMLSVTHIFLISILTAVIAMTLYEYIVYKNTKAIRHLLVLGVLAAAILLELLNYHRQILFQSSAFFAFGMYAFFIVFNYSGLLFIHDIAQIRHREKELEHEVQLMKLQQKEDQEWRNIIQKQESDARRMRHDLQHQFLKIRGIAMQEKSARIVQCIDAWLRSVPTGMQRFCDNSTVNLVVSYHHSCCEDRNIRLETYLTVPEHMEDVTDSELCAIFGNLLENAYEACCRKKTGERFIRIASILRDDRLIITMENSSDGKTRQINGRFISSKTGEIGIGLEEAFLSLDGEEWDDFILHGDAGAGVSSAVKAYRIQEKEKIPACASAITDSKGKALFDVADSYGIYLLFQSGRRPETTAVKYTGISPVLVFVPLLQSGPDGKSGQWVIHQTLYPKMLENTGTSVRIRKRAMDPEGNLTETKVIGAGLQILDEQGRIAESWTTTDVDHDTNPLKPGRYTLREYQVPEGYILAEDISFRILPDGRIESEASESSEAVLVMADPVKQQVTAMQTTPPTLQQPDKTPEVVSTGDRMNAGLWALITIAAACAVVTVMMRRKRRDT